MNECMVSKFFVVFLCDLLFFFFFFNDTATTEIYTLSLHDALPISAAPCAGWQGNAAASALPHRRGIPCGYGTGGRAEDRSEEHTSELQSHSDLVCRLLLEKKKKKYTNNILLLTHQISLICNPSL